MSRRFDDTDKVFLPSSLDITNPRLLLGAVAVGPHPPAAKTILPYLVQVPANLLRSTERQGAATAVNQATAKTTLTAIGFGRVA